MRHANSSPPRRAIESTGAHDAPQALGDLGQKLIARGVAERVVDLLETIEIHQQQRELAAVTGRDFDRAIDVLTEQHSVREPRQRVVHRLMAVQLSLLAKLMLRDVASLLGQHPLAGVEDHAIQPCALSVVVEHCATVLGNPTEAAIGVDQSVRQRIRRTLLQGTLDVHDHLRPIVGMDQRTVATHRVVGEVARWIPDEGLDVLADERHRPVRVTTTPVDDAGNVGHHGPKPLIAGPEPRLGILTDGGDRRRRGRELQSAQHSLRRCADKSGRTRAHRWVSAPWRPNSSQAPSGAGRCLRGRPAAEIAKRSGARYNRHIPVNCSIGERRGGG